MHTIKLKIAAIFLFAGLLAIIHGCKDDDFDVPIASTQADFVFDVENPFDTANFRVQFTNKSILAESYLWTFGNGQTSTEANPLVIYASPGQYTVKLEVGSKTNVYYNRLTKTVSLALGKQVVYAEDFQSGVGDPLGEDWLPEGWQAIDADGDGFNWYFGVRQGVGTMRSQSWDGDPLTPDNWLIMPEIDLTSAGSEALIVFNYSVGITANTAAYRREHYGVFISIGSNNLENFELLFEETMLQTTPNWVPQERTINLSDYAGHSIYLAFRHYNVTDMDRIFIREVEVYKIE